MLRGPTPVGHGQKSPCPTRVNCLHVFDRTAIGNAAGGARQRLPGAPAADIPALADRTNGTGRRDLRCPAPGRDAAAVGVIPAVPATVAVSGRLAHPPGPG